MSKNEKKAINLIKEVYVSGIYSICDFMIERMKLDLQLQDDDAVKEYIKKIIDDLEDIRNGKAVIKSVEEN